MQGIEVCKSCLCAIFLSALLVVRLKSVTASSRIASGVDGLTRPPSPVGAKSPLGCLWFECVLRKLTSELIE